MSLFGSYWAEMLLRERLTGWLVSDVLSFAVNRGGTVKTRAKAAKQQPRVKGSEGGGLGG